MNIGKRTSDFGCRVSGVLCPAAKTCGCPQIARNPKSEIRNPSYDASLMLTNRPIRPRSRNSTTPVILANNVSSLPQPTFSPGFRRVPRCRTMMEPPGTNWPPKTFTPRRCALESRPFLELPSPFLCAILPALRDDLVHPQFREMLAMADGAFVLLFALELENEYFLRAVVRRDSGDYLGVCQLRFGKRFAVLEHREHIRELQRRTYIERQLLDADHVAGGHPVLFPACLNDCVHGTSSWPGTPRAPEPMV